MKSRIIYPLIFALLLSMQAAFADYKNVICPTDDTDCTLVTSTATANISPRLIVVNSQAEDTFIIQCGSGGNADDQIGPFKVSANGGFTINLKEHGRSTEFYCPPSEDLKAVKGTSSTVMNFWFTFDQ